MRSREGVDHLVRHPVPAPFLLVVSRRDRQAPAALTTAPARGADTGAVLTIALGPPGERHCVEELAPDLPRQRAAEMYATSEGNPLYFLALLQAHRTTRLPGAGRLPVTDGNGPPLGLEALLLHELTPLDSPARSAAEAAAVLGDHVTAG
ncbi:hypothetical protein ACIQK6_07955 [Streptomyces sp. NPDC091682]|uniref:hypothetical protein n=1 Tax=Streptomyces sp. NPDC091682 TaxID=3366005 RepID=UPI003819C227